MGGGQIPVSVGLDQSKFKQGVKVKKAARIAAIVGITAALVIGIPKLASAAVAHGFAPVSSSPDTGINDD
jgi:hypothetical protein